MNLRRNDFIGGPDALAQQRDFDYSQKFVHWEGFRCQHARPIALVGKRLPGLATLDSPEELVEFALEHGSPVPSDQRPERGTMDPFYSYAPPMPHWHYSPAYYTHTTNHTAGVYP